MTIIKSNWLAMTGGLTQLYISWNNRIKLEFFLAEAADLMGMGDEVLSGDQESDPHRDDER